jgi:peroxiredoxin family protein
MTLEERIASLEEQVQTLSANAPEDKLSMVVFSGDMDHLLAAMIIATGSSAMFESTQIFFTFWATAALRDPKKTPPPKSLVSKMFGWMLPKGAPAVKLGKMHMCGLGTGMMKGLMRKQNILSLEQLFERAAANGVQITVCEMSMNLMGIAREELIDYPDLKLAGVGTFLANAGSSKSTLFI